jgi:hypothetical protein
MRSLRKIIMSTHSIENPDSVIHVPTSAVIGLGVDDFECKLQTCNAWECVSAQSSVMDMGSTKINSFSCESYSSSFESNNKEATTMCSVMDDLKSGTATYMSLYPEKSTDGGTFQQRCVSKPRNWTRSKKQPVGGEPVCCCCPA